MKRGIVATLGLAFAVVVGFGLFGAAPQASANHVAAPNEITISIVGSPLVAVGTDVTIQLAVTTSTTAHKAIQWEAAYGANLSNAASAIPGATYTCVGPNGPNINYANESDTPPVESVLIPAIANNLGGGSNCASLTSSGPLAGGVVQVGNFVTFTLRCLAPGNTFVSMRPATDPATPGNDPLFGTTLLDSTGAAITTVLENTLAIPGFGTQAAVGLACATPVDYATTKTPASQNVAGGGTITQTITIANPDPAVGSHSTLLTDNLPVPVAGHSLVLPAGCAVTGAAQFKCGTPLGGPATPNGGSTSYTFTYTALAGEECSTLTNTAIGTPGDSSTADTNPGNNTATAAAVVDCPILTLTKNCVDDNGPPAFTDDTFTCTIVVSNDAGGSSALAVVLNDVFSGGMTFVSGTAPCAGGFPCALGTIASPGSVSVTVVEKAPATAGTACNTAQATQTAPGASSNSVQRCQDVKSKFPTINGLAKDTGVTPLNPDGTLNNNFSFTVGNIFLCKGSVSLVNLPPLGAFSGAGETACGTFVISEVGQAPTGTDTCNDDDDADGKPCQGDPQLGPSAYQVQTDLCKNLATDYMPGQTAVDCGGPVVLPKSDPVGPGSTTNEGAEGLGALEFQVKFDDKLFQSPTFVCAPLGARFMMAQVSIITENWVQFGCASKNHAPGLPGLPVVPGIDITNATVLGQLTLKIQPDLFSRMRPAKDNGVSTNLLDENCEFADILGQPYNLGLGTYGGNQAPSGGLTNDCKDAAITIRMLEGDVDLNCIVDIFDDQAIAFRYGQFFGQLNYNRFFDLEPGISPDFDIDIKDVQTVFGRNGSTCAAPIPDQPPLSTIPDP